MDRKRYHKVTDKAKAKILLLAQQGVKVKYIKARFDVSESTVHEIIKELHND